MSRKTAVAGLFYPDDPTVLQRQLATYLGDGEPAVTAPKALIVPHAGYIYSGPTAGRAYRQLYQQRGSIERVVLLGPSHRVTFAGLAASGADDFSTPLGPVRVDRVGVDRVLSLPQLSVSDEAHREEHSLEVQLPFLQTVLGADFGLVPLVAGASDGEQVAEVIESLWGGPETLFVVSSDLSHYHDYATAQQLDRATSQAIERLDPESIDYNRACGRDPINGLLLAARHHHLHASTVDLCNSGDTAGDRARVVGYGTYAFT